VAAAVVGMAIVAVIVVAACDVTPAVTLPLPPVASRPATPTTSAAPPPLGPAVAALAALPVKGRAPKTGYARAQFGPAWADTDHDGCDQRNQVLGRDLTAVVKRGRCVVVAGLLHDPYTDAAVPFIRGALTSDDVQIDHVVALSNAWQTGAQSLDVHQRELIATDPLNLLAVNGPTNQSKGDGDAATWLPPAKGYRCAYVARQVAVKTRYKLWVTPAERAAIARVLTDCPAQALP
jgi:Protein of unknown function (DUF1524)